MSSMETATDNAGRGYLDVTHRTARDHMHRRGYGTSSSLAAICTMLLIAPLLASTPAAAQGTHHGGFISARPQRGTHFIAEVAGGLATLQGPGPALEALVGVGGRPRWSPLRFYLFGEFAYTTGSIYLRTAGGDPSEQTHENRDFGAGLRAYVPLGPVRLFTDALGGTTNLVVTQQDERLGYTTDRQRWLPYFGFAAGLQLRLMRHVSVGVRAKAVFTDTDAVADLTGAIDSPSGVRLTTTGGITFHF